VFTLFDLSFMLFASDFNSGFALFDLSFDLCFKLFDSSVNDSSVKRLELRLCCFHPFSKRSQLIAKRPWQIPAANRFI